MRWTVEQITDRFDYSNITLKELSDLSGWTIAELKHTLLEQH
jgi:hypothetical protein